MNKVLIIVDMQNDFIDGTLANRAAQECVQPICEYIKNFAKDYDTDDISIICTMDTHHDDYMKTSEGLKLPVKHCIVNTPGWLINNQIRDTLSKIPDEVAVDYVCKSTFGYIEWCDHISEDIDEIHLVGTCTDICVVSNALILKTYFPEAEIIVHDNMCAGLTKEKHKAALEVMKSCQIEVI